MTIHREKKKVKVKVIKIYRDPLTGRRFIRLGGKKVNIGEGVTSKNVIEFVKMYRKKAKKAKLKRKMKMPTVSRVFGENVSRSLAGDPIGAFALAALRAQVEKGKQEPVDVDKLTSQILAKIVKEYPKEDRVSVVDTIKNGGSIEYNGVDYNAKDIYQILQNAQNYINGANKEKDNAQNKAAVAKKQAQNAEEIAKTEKELAKTEKAMYKVADEEFNDIAKKHKEKGKAYPTKGKLVRAMADYVNIKEKGVKVEDLVVPVITKMMKKDAYSKFYPRSKELYQRMRELDKKIQILQKPITSSNYKESPDREATVEEAQAMDESERQRADELRKRLKEQQKTDDSASSSSALQAPPEDEGLNYDLFNPLAPPSSRSAPPPTIVEEEMMIDPVNVNRGFSDEYAEQFESTSTPLRPRRPTKEVVERLIKSPEYQLRMRKPISPLPQSVEEWQKQNRIENSRAKKPDVFEIERRRENARNLVYTQSESSSSSSMKSHPPRMYEESAEEEGERRTKWMKTILETSARLLANKEEAEIRGNVIPPKLIQMPLSDSGDGVVQILSPGRIRMTEREWIEAENRAASRSGPGPVYEDDEDSEHEQSGNGRRRYREPLDPSKGLSTDQLDDMMHGFPDYLGTIGSDQIGDLPVKPKSRLGFVMNLDPSHKPGYHWVAVFVDARPNGSHSIEYFDSLANAPSEKFMSDIKALASKLRAGNYLKFKTNEIADQQRDTTNCGFFAAKFLIDRFRGKTFGEASGYKADHTIGEERIERFKKGYPYLGFSIDQEGGGFREFGRRRSADGRR